MVRDGAQRFLDGWRGMLCLRRPVQEPGSLLGLRSVTTVVPLLSGRAGQSSVTPMMMKGGRRMKRRILAPLALALTILTGGLVIHRARASSVAAAPTGDSPGGLIKPVTQTKPPWDWTVDERLAARHDPNAAAERVRSARRDGRIAAQAVSDDGAQSPSDQVDFISGRDHPELLLSWEIFDTMASLAYADDPDARSTYREAKAPGIAAAGLPVDFWDALQAISSAYLADQSQLRDLHKGAASNPEARRRIEVTTEGLEVLKCRDRAAAIAAARRKFGRSFDRFLYESAVANMFISTARGGLATEARDRETEEGCR